MSKQFRKARLLQIHIVVLILFLTGSANGLYRAFSSVFATAGITKASEFCPTFQQDWKESHYITRPDNLFLTGFDPEEPTVPACTFRSKFMKNVEAHLLGGFISYNVTWIDERAETPKQKCTRRIKLEVQCKNKEIVIPRMLCRVPNILLKEIHTLKPSLWIYSSGDIGVTFPGTLGSYIMLSRKYTFVNPLFAHLVFKTIDGNDCSIQVEQYRLTQKSCDNELPLPFGCLIYNCSDEAIIFDEIRRITNEQYETGRHGLKNEFDRRDLEKSIKNSETFNDHGLESPVIKAAPRQTYRWMYAWVPCAIVWCATILRKQGKRNEQADSSPPMLICDVPVEEVTDLRPDNEPDVNSSILNWLELQVTDLPPPYESLKPPSYAEATGYRNSYKINALRGQSDCV